jgi:hypothetical protein
VLTFSITDLLVSWVFQAQSVSKNKLLADLTISLSYFEKFRDGCEQQEFHLLFLDPILVVYDIIIMLSFLNLD